MKVRALVIATEEAGYKGSTLLWRVSMFLMVVGLCVYVIGFATPYYLEADGMKVDGSEWGTSAATASLDQHFGLWRRCSKVKVGDDVIRDECEDMDNDQSWKPAAKSMNCVGLIIMVLGLIPAFMAGSVHSGKLMGMAAVMVLVGALTSAIGSALFIGEAKDDNDSLDAGYSSYMALGGCVVLILGAGLQFLNIRSEYASIA